jgi:hypothetical protein
MTFDCNEWHPERQWMITAVDIAKGEERTFAMSGIHAWSNKPFEHKQGDEE